MSLYTNFTVEDYNYWVFEMDDKLDSFLNSLPAEIQQKLNYSLDSLVDLGNWIIKRYQNQIERFESLGHAIVVDGACRYTGETIRKDSGGFWDIDTESNDVNKKSVPYVTGFGKSEQKYYPYLELKKAIEKNDSSCILQDYLNEVNNK